MPSASGSELGRMRSVERGSIAAKFPVCKCHEIPDVPLHGARIKVHFAGACYTDTQAETSGYRGLNIPGVRDTSLFPGYEVCGTVDAVCDSEKETCALQKGDRVLLYPGDEERTENRFAEYIQVSDLNNLIPLPANLPMEVAVLLPSGGLTAYTAISKAMPYLKQNTTGTCNVLLIGAGGLGMLTLTIAQYMISESSSTQNAVQITVADASVDKLMAVQSYHSSVQVVHWDDAIHEQHILERTRNACCNGVDVIIDFISSRRTYSRSIQLLNRDGLLVVCGNSRHDVTLCPYELTRLNQSVLCAGRGSRRKLHELVQIFAAHQIEGPVYEVYPVEEASQVFAKLHDAQLIGRAVFKITHDEYT